MALKTPFAFFSPLVHRMIGDETAGALRPMMLDAVLEEEEEHSLTMTEHPIEVPQRVASSAVRGRVADHVFRNPVKYSMQAVVSDFPISWKQFNEYGNSVLATRSQGAYDLLMAHFNTGEPFDLVTTWGQLPNMVLTRLVIPRTKRTASTLEFSAELREAMIVIPPDSSVALDVEDVSGEQAESGAVREINYGVIS